MKKGIVVFLVIVIFIGLFSLLISEENKKASELETQIAVASDRFKDSYWKFVNTSIEGHGVVVNYYLHLKSDSTVECLEYKYYNDSPVERVAIGYDYTWEVFGYQETACVEIKYFISDLIMDFYFIKVSDEESEKLFCIDVLPDDINHPGNNAYALTELSEDEYNNAIEHEENCLLNAANQDRKPNNKLNSFTNKYGTSTTKCAHAGCDRYIASSGDTNCCTQHSNRCLNCNKYIDEDAMYCMSCLASALGK